MERKSVDPITLILAILLLLALSLQWLEITKDKRVLTDDTATALFCSAEAMPVDAEVAFSDLTPGHWAYGAVSDLTSRGVIQGYLDGTFQPEAPLRYGEFIKLILASQGVDTGQTAQELSWIHWALGHYLLALEEGYFTIHDIKKQQLDRPIPRGVMALLISSVLQKGSNRLTIKDYEGIRNAIGDVSAATPYEYDIVASYASGILKGYEDQTFRPAQGLTRAEGAAAIQRLMTLQKQEAGQQQKGSDARTTHSTAISRILSPEEVDKIVSLGPITDYRIVLDPTPFDLSVRDSRYGGQKILSIRTEQPVCFLAGNPETGQMKVLLAMTEGRSQYPSNTGLTARYFVGDLRAADYIAISPPYKFGAKEGTLTLVPNPFRATKL